MPRTPKGAATSAPITRPYTLGSGRAVTFEQPDLFDLASGKIDIPNAAKLDIWHLLYRAGADDPQQQLLSDERYARSLYYAAQLVIRPRVRLDDEDADAVIERRELSLPDLLAAFSFLRYGPPPLADDRELGDGQAAAPAGDGVPGAAEWLLWVDRAGGAHV